MNPATTPPTRPTSTGGRATGGSPSAPGARRRWPLLAIGASAGTAVWSGWVGLGELTGFGVVRPLPGIADSFAINTAVTLPIGVEAYAMYALSIATSSRALPDRTRRYAWASSAAALLLGMAGQVAYHLMTAHPPPEQQSQQLAGSAPWWVIALVSCLPVLVLGAASLLWHLAGETDPAAESRPEPLVLSRTKPSGQSRPESRTGFGPGAQASPQPGPGSKPSPAASPRPARPAGPESVSTTPGVPVARETDLHRVRAAIAAGDLPARPTVEAIRSQLGIGRAYARAARTQISSEPTITPDADTSAIPDPSTAGISLNGHAFTPPSSRSEESANSTDSPPEHRTEALFTDHPPQSFSSSTHDLNPVST